MGLKSLNCGKKGGDWGASQFPHGLIPVLHEYLLERITKPSGGDISGTTTLLAGNMVRYCKHGSPHGEDWLSPGAGPTRC